MNNRIFYACQAVLLEVPKNPFLSSNHFIPGVQSIGINGSQDIIPINDIGRSQGFINLYQQPTNEITIERILSDIDYFWLQKSFAVGATSFTTYKDSYLLNKDNLGSCISGWNSGNKSAVQPSILSEYNLKLIYTQDSTSVIGSSGLSGTALDIVSFPYCLLNSLSYNISTDGFVTESITLSNKIRKKEASNSFSFDTRGGSSATGNTESTYVNALRRKNIDNSLSVYPYIVQQLVDFNDFKDGQEIFGITGIEINLNLEYQQAKDIGKWRGAGGTTNAEKAEEVNMFTSLTNIEVGCSFTITTRRSQQFNIDNIHNNYLDGNQTNDQRICIVAKIKDPINNNYKFFIWNLGNANKLVSFSQTGGDSSGGIVEYTVEYKNTNNDFVTYTQNQASESPLSPGLFQQTSENY